MVGAAHCVRSESVLREHCAHSPAFRLQCAQGMRTVRVVDNTDRRTAEHSSLTANQRSQRARIAARARWAQQSGTEGTEPARRAFLERFERQVDPDGTLPPAERARRAESAKREHFQRLAYARHRKSA